MAYLEYIPNDPLFHYTSMDGFKNIMETGKFWFSDLSASNDPREKNLAKKKIYEAIFHFDRMQLPPEARTNVMLLTSSLARVIGVQSVFSLCLTKNRDDISQWKEYADQGKGISFSVRARALRDMFVRIQQVKYVDELETGLFDNIVEAQYEQLRYLNEGLPFEVEIDIVTNLLSAIYSIKHSTWKDEREIRLTFASTVREERSKYPLAEYPDGTDIPYSLPLTRGSKDNQVPFYELPFGRYDSGSYDKTGAIGEIIVGPNCKAGIDEIKEFMKKKGFKNLNVSDSLCMFNPR